MTVYAVCALVTLLGTGEQLVLQAFLQITPDRQQCLWEVANARERYVESLAAYLDEPFALDELLCLTEAEFNAKKATL